MYSTNTIVHFSRYIYLTFPFYFSNSARNLLKAFQATRTELYVNLKMKVRQNTAIDIETE